MHFSIKTYTMKNISIKSNEYIIIILQEIMINFKIGVLTVLVVLSSARNYPLYKQCDSRWANEKLGTSSTTICRAGCLMSSASMALSGTGHSYNPHTLNQWLTSHGGYVRGDLFVWASISKLGLTWKGFISNSAIKSNLDAGNVVICNVHNGGHWVLAHGYSGDNILVNDPGYSTTSYHLSAIVSGNTGVYRSSRMPTILSYYYYSAVEYISDFFGVEKDIAEEPIPDVNFIIDQ